LVTRSLCVTMAANRRRAETRAGQTRKTLRRRDSLKSVGLVRHSCRAGSVCESPMKEWDVFISYASEDRNTVAMPLATALTRAGLRVWIDQTELFLGDSLREAIDLGLARSQFGVVILSPSFLGKVWPGRELSALFALEELASAAIFPIWHQISRDTLAQHSPILADRVGISTDAGINKVASEILSR
jgi:hypothetical protein